MDILKAFNNVIQQIAQQMSNVGTWLTEPLLELEGLQITPLTIMLPATLMIILAYLIIRFLLV